MTAVPGQALDGRPPIFVGGLPRNGTTLVGRLLGSHSEIALPPDELGFFQVFWRPGEPPDRPRHGRSELEARLERLLRRIPGWELPEDEVLEAARDDGLAYRDLFVFLLDLYRRRTGKPRVAEKTVYYHQWLDVLDAWFEDYRFVHVVRNPIDAFASIKWFKRGTPRPNRVDLVPWLHEWNESAALALHRSHARPDRYCLVRYEDVVARPADTLEGVCKLVGVAPEPERMLELRSGEATESSFVEESGRIDYDGRIRRSDEVDRSQRIDRRELDAIRSACAPLAHLLGYDVGPLRTRRGSVGQPVPGRVPLKVGLPFVVDRVRKLLVHSSPE
jgi:Sulfotransferase family